MAILRKKSMKGSDLRARSYPRMPMDERADPRIVIRDYRHNVQSLQSRFDGAPPMDDDSCDLLIAIDAPSPVIDMECLLTLYLDPAHAPERVLSENAWQVRCGQALPSMAFSEWADDVSRMLAKVLLESAVVSVDLVDLHSFLRQSLTRQMTCVLLDWADLNQLPALLKGQIFPGALGALFASAEQLDVRLFAKAGSLFEQITSPDGLHIFSARLHSGSVPRLLLIGIDDHQCWIA